MKNISPAESTMWDKSPPEAKTNLSDWEINQKYNSNDFRIVTETNREQLPNFVAALKRPGWLNLQPFYQRRKRWDVTRQSKLIESFIMNIPIPPCFFYESDFARFEVMDGQQRITTIQEFYGNKFALKGLEQWPELNGKTYDRLPSDIKNGLDRRSISYFVLLKESAKSTENEFLLRQQVFERLNTGGIELENQEVRHCIYHNDFDELLMKLSKHPGMRKPWGLPVWSPEEDLNIPDSLMNSPHYAKMRDSEFILRFFALRHIDEYRAGMQRFLDQYMVRSRTFQKEDIEYLRHLFVETISTAEAIYCEHLFKPWDAGKSAYAKKPQIAYADAVMVGISHHIERKNEMVEKREVIVQETKKLIEGSDSKLFTGQRNTKESVISRLETYDKMLVRAIA